MQLIKDGPVHEAYLSSESSVILLRAVPLKPPSPLTEPIPPQDDPYLAWIPGHWGWSDTLGDFIWISGVWRRLPPGKMWIPGYWQKLNQGWVWMTGFWSDVPYDQLVFLEETPPPPLDEKAPPAPSENSQWLSGYWQWEDSKGYQWKSGRWEDFDKEWVYVPPRYIWKEHGYIFLPAGWDWALEDRGEVFLPAYIDPEVRSTVVYEPIVTTTPEAVIKAYFPKWPDYQSVYHTQFHLHPDLWKKWGFTPPWWNFMDWWTLNTRQQWALWWWWTHPGFPQPTFLSNEAASNFTPPPKALLQRMAKERPYSWITADGVVSMDAYLAAMQKVMGKNYGPVLPTDPDIIGYIESVAKPQMGIPPTVYFPGATQLPKEPPALLFSEQNGESNQASIQLTVPPKPKLSKEYRKKAMTLPKVQSNPSHSRIKPESRSDNTKSSGKKTIDLEECSIRARYKLDQLAQMKVNVGSEGEKLPVIKVAFPGLDSPSSPPGGATANPVFRPAVPHVYSRLKKLNTNARPIPPPPPETEALPTVSAPIAPSANPPAHVAAPALTSTNNSPKESLPQVQEPPARLPPQVDMYTVEMMPEPDPVPPPIYRPVPPKPSSPYPTAAGHPAPQPVPLIQTRPKQSFMPRYSLTSGSANDPIINVPSAPISQLPSVPSDASQMLQADLSSIQLDSREINAQPPLYHPQQIPPTRSVDSPLKAEVYHTPGGVHISPNYNQLKPEITQGSAFQGARPDITWPPVPLAQQDLGTFMSHPQPQKNPLPPVQSFPSRPKKGWNQ